MAGKFRSKSKASRRSRPDPRRGDSLASSEQAPDEGRALRDFRSKNSFEATDRTTGIPLSSTEMAWPTVELDKRRGEHGFAILFVSTQLVQHSACHAMPLARERKAVSLHELYGAAVVIWAGRYSQEAGGVAMRTIHQLSTCFERTRGAALQVVG